MCFRIIFTLAVFSLIMFVILVVPEDTEKYGCWDFKIRFPKYYIWISRLMSSLLVTYKWHFVLTFLLLFWGEGGEVYFLGKHGILVVLAQIIKVFKTKHNNDHFIKLLVYLLFLHLLKKHGISVPFVSFIVCIVIVSRQNLYYWLWPWPSWRPFVRSIIKQNNRLALVSRAMLLFFMPQDRRFGVMVFQVCVFVCICLLALNFWCI